MIINVTKILHVVKHYLVGVILYLTSTFGTCYLLFPLKPLLFINRRHFHSLSDLALSTWLGLAVFLLEKVCQIKIFFHVSKSHCMQSSAKRSGLIIMNHRTLFDWLFYFCILYRLNQLATIKIILKDVLKKIPGPGWAMQTGLFIFIRRRWELDQKIFSKFINYFRYINKTVNILIFPEGTDYTKQTLERSDRFAKENNLPKYTQVLHPRTTGFVYIFNQLNTNGMVNHIDDVTVAYAGGKIPEKEIDLLNGNLPHEIHFFVDTFECGKIFEPNKQSESGQIAEEENDKALETWLKDRWRVKESMLVSFYESRAESADQSKKATDFNEKYQSLYETQSLSPVKAGLIYFFPVFWLSTMLIVSYLVYSFFIYKIYFISAFLFYFVYIQLIGKHLDHWIVSKLDTEVETVSAATSVSKKN